MIRRASSLEAALQAQCGYVGLFPESEYRFHPTRRWRFDLAFPAQLVAVEVEGGTWINGRHNRGAGFTQDCEKYAEAAALGWRVIRVTGQHIRSGEALTWIERALGTALSEVGRCGAAINVRG